MDNSEKKYEKENEYGFYNGPEPLNTTPVFDAAVKAVLWYSPDGRSYRSIKNQLEFTDKADQKIYIRLLRRLGIDYGSDAVLESLDFGSPGDWSPRIYNSPVDGLSLVGSLFSHLRDAFAHGRFDISDNGNITLFDWYGKYNFFLRADVHKFIEAVRYMLPQKFVNPQGHDTSSDKHGDNASYGQFLEDLVMDLLQDCSHFRIQRPHCEEYVADFVCEHASDGKIIGLDIKYIPDVRRLGAIKKRRDAKKPPFKIVTLVLEPDRSLSEKTVLEYNEYDAVLIDVDGINKLIKGDDVIGPQIERILS